MSIFLWFCSSCVHWKLKQFWGLSLRFWYLVTFIIENCFNWGSMLYKSLNIFVLFIKENRDPRSPTGWSNSLWTKWCQFQCFSHLLVDSFKVSFCNHEPNTMSNNLTFASSSFQCEVQLNMYCHLSFMQSFCFVVPIWCCAIVYSICFLVKQKASQSLSCLSCHLTNNSCLTIITTDSIYQTRYLLRGLKPLLTNSFCITPVLSRFVFCIFLLKAVEKQPLLV